MKSLSLVKINWQEELPEGCDHRQNPEGILKLWTEYFHDSITNQAGRPSILMPERRPTSIQNVDAILNKAKELALQFSNQQ